jgi:hypothetical protein
MHRCGIRGFCYATQWRRRPWKRSIGPIQCLVRVDNEPWHGWELPSEWVWQIIRRGWDANYWITVHVGHLRPRLHGLFALDEIISQPMKLAWHCRSSFSPKNNDHKHNLEWHS